MTAFGTSQKVADNFSVSAEIRGLNSRVLDISIRAGHGWLPFEERIRNLIALRVTRGRIEVLLKVQDKDEEAVAFEVNSAKARAYYNSLLKLKMDLGLEDAAISLDLIAAEGACISPVERQVDLDEYWPLVTECVQAATEDLDIMRCREGAAIARDLQRRLAFIEDCLTRIQNESNGLLAVYQQRLQERIAALTQRLVEIDSERVAQEAAFLADRSDISEEIVRLKSHIDQYRRLMDAEEPAGRKLNFLVQEMNRELNTIGSKTEKAQVAHLVVDAKSELEKIREQIQNVE